MRLTLQARSSARRTRWVALANLAALAALGAGRLALVSSVSIQPQQVQGGGTATGTVAISGAGAFGTVVSLSSSDPAVASVPPSVTIGARSSGASFVVSTAAGAAGCPRIAAAIARSTGAPQSAQLFVTPPAQSGTFRMGVSSPVVVGGATSSGVLSNSVPIPGPPPTVFLTSSNPGVTVPATVALTLSEVGIPSVSFPIHTTVVGSTTCSVISARLGTTTVKALLKIVSISG